MADDSLSPPPPPPPPPPPLPAAYFPDDWDSEEEGELGFPDSDDQPEDDNQDQHQQEKELEEGEEEVPVVLMSFPPPPPAAPPTQDTEDAEGLDSTTGQHPPPPAPPAPPAQEEEEQQQQDDAEGAEEGAMSDPQEQAPAPAPAGSAQAGKTSPLSGKNANVEQLDPLAVSVSDVRSYSPGEEVVAVVASEGNVMTGTPPFKSGDRFVVKCTDESGWIETECGAHLWPTWLVRSGEEISTRLQNVSLADDEMHPPKEEEVLEFQLDKADGSFGFKMVGGIKDVGVFVKAIRKGGAADVSGVLRRGDQIIRVNGTSFESICHDDALKTLQTCTCPATFAVRRDPDNLPKIRSVRSSVGSLTQLRSAPAPRSISVDDVLQASEGDKPDEKPTGQQTAPSSAEGKAFWIDSLPTIKAETDKRRASSESQEQKQQRLRESKPQQAANADEDNEEVPDVPLKSNIAAAPESAATTATTSAAKATAGKPVAKTAAETVVSTEDMALSQKKGWLKIQDLKKSRSKVNLFGSGQYARRYVVLQDCMMKHFKKIPNSRHSSASHIVLDRDTEVKMFSDRGFHLQTERVSLNMIADSKTSADNWVKVLKNITARYHDAESNI